MVISSVLASYLCLLLLYESNGEACVNGDIRLAGISNSYLEGRVEVCYAGMWGTVCDDWWDQNEARVVCRQLGFSSSGALAFTNAHFGQGMDPILLDNLQCTGNESNILQCLADTNCVHSEDAGVRCQNNDVALVYKGQLLANNSLISVEALTSSESISCVSTLPSCCDTTRAGNWFSPNSTAPLPSSPGTESFYQSWTNDQTIQLHRFNTSTTQEGLFSCHVPDAENITQTFYVGIYSSASNGTLNITSLAYERSSHTLVCTSTGGPATSVTWSRDGVPLEVNGVTYQQSQVIVDTVNSIYENRLLLVNKSSVYSGLYGCRVENSAGTAFDSTQLEVCRDDEVRLVIGEDSITSALEVCDEDTWQRSISYPFRIPVIEPAPRNVQVQPHLHGFMVSWELPSSSGDILSQEVTCSDRSGLAIYITADQTSVLTVIPVTSSVPLECCVTTITRTPTTIGTLAAQTCAANNLLPDTTDILSNQVSDATVEVLPPTTQTDSQTLVFVLGGVATVLFLTLVVVVILLMGLLLLHARGKKEHTEEDIRSSSNLSSPKTIERKNPVYEVVADFTDEVRGMQSRSTTSEGNIQLQNNVWYSTLSGNIPIQISEV